MDISNSGHQDRLDLTAYLSSEGVDGQHPEFFDASDVSQSNIASHFRSMFSNFVESATGALRLTGEGVVGHSVSLIAAGGILQQFQALVTSLGASLEGKKTARGKLPNSIIQETELLLDASPAPGSVILNFSPVSDRELGADIEPQLPLVVGEDVNVPLVERAINEFIGLLDIEDSQDSRWQDSLAARIDELGPRVANSMSSFSSELDSNRIDLDFKWKVPGGSVTRLRFGSQRSSQVRKVLESIRVTNHVVAVKATIQKISSVAPEQMELHIIEKLHEDSFPTDFPSVVTVSVPTEVADVADFRVRQTVEVLALVDRSSFSGRTPSFSVEAHRFLSSDEFSQIDIEQVAAAFDETTQD